MASVSLARGLRPLLEHAHLLVFRPRDASPAAMQALLDAGWSTTAIVTLSQLVAFLSFQVRAVAGLRTLGASLGHQQMRGQGGLRSKNMMIQSSFMTTRMNRSSLPRTSGLAALAGAVSRSGPDGAALGRPGR
jgi:hypothetical protein